ncbi:MAG: glycosyltransferase family 2 protein [Candidatus Schekmanbacteria bacterium]|nr:glycosyltransferase family 2 protein [Candidatus Schekmanbacteria bacterium]
MYNGKKISVVMPCYNEEAAIGGVIKSIPRFVDEVIVSDNNSTDRTGEIATSLGAKVVFEERKGYGRAYKTGLKCATGDIIATLDGDGTYPALAIPYLVDILLVDKLDFISARRIFSSWDILSKKNYKEAVLRYIGNTVLSLSVLFLFGKSIHDSQSGMWVFKREVLSQINVLSDGMPFSEELKIEVFTNKNLRAREIPIEFFYQKREGVSKLNLWGDGTKNLLYLFKKRFSLINGGTKW